MTRPFNAQDALALITVGEAGFVAGGRFLYWEESRISDDREVLTIWILDRSTGVARKAAEEFVDPRRPVSSPDGTELAFVAKIAGQYQLCVLAIDTGASEVLTTLDGGVTGHPAWSPSGSQIAFTARSRPNRDRSQPYRVRRVTYRFEGIGLIDDAVQDLYVIDMPTKAVERLTDEDAIVEAAAWAPGGKQIFFRLSFAPDEAWLERPRIVVVDVETRCRKEILRNWGRIRNLAAHPDGQHLVFTGTPAPIDGSTPFVWKWDLWILALATGEVECRTADLRSGASDYLEFDSPRCELDRPLRLDDAGSTAYMSAQDGGDVAIICVALSGNEQVDILVEPASQVCLLADRDPSDGALLFVSSTLNRPFELFLWTAGESRQLTDSNRPLAALVADVPVHPLRVVAPDGTAIQAWAMTPSGIGPFPTVLVIHGGPMGAYGNVFMIDVHVLVGAGFAVVFANFRGSGGYGNEFHQALHGRWGPLGEQDHHATLDAAIAAGITDPGRLGVYGLSHGGFATCWLLSRSRRFKAGIAENPVVNWVSMYGTVDAPDSWLIPELGGRPEETLARYRELSPLTYAHSCATPLLLIVGECDLRCPPSEAEQFYRALTAQGTIVEMLRLPEANHTGSWSGPIPVRHAQNVALVEWFTRHV